MMKIQDVLNYEPQKLPRYEYYDELLLKFIDADRHIPHHESLPIELRGYDESAIKTSLNRVSLSRTALIRSRSYSMVYYSRRVAQQAFSDEV
ncbi:uncharacterized protein L3040_005440 [Drepanopeziza brunnea f. sp. 'multigermtubi']|uniref:uncharacterized protein n=1 Tax=Drepanopeziza brunnea f. sp. 'multigermtubi' TaxID=698441 RepID=UPI00239BF503|nr:hypothetical protein L3040_005440 [Drepanopeziza brunnea f. sp. 'multigermtubi']